MNIKIFKLLKLFYKEYRYYTLTFFVVNSVFSNDCIVYILNLIN